MGAVLSYIEKIAEPLNQPTVTFKTFIEIVVILSALCIFVLIILTMKARIEKSIPGANSCLSLTRLMNDSISLVKSGYNKSKPSSEAFKDFKDMGLEGRKSLYSDLINGLEPGERFLVNLCPLTASLGGYIGTDSPGVFNSDFYIQNALRAGIRSFVLPISVYIDDNKFPPKWPLSGMPAIVCRNADGKILSANGLSVREFCNNVLTFMNENPDQANEPILIYIHETEGYVPNRISQEKKYVKLMSNIASELSVIHEDRRLVVVGGYGSAVRSANEAAILTQIPLTDLKSKVIIFTNFESKLGLKPVYDTITPKLMDYVNFTVKPVIAQNIGLSVSAGSACRSLKLLDTSGNKVNWSDQARTVWHMTTQDDPLVMQSEDAISIGTRSGIQMIPIPIFMTKDVGNVKKVWEKWNGYAWRLKEKEARYLKPAEVKPQPPNARMNARISPNMQPGVVAVL
jgi:hypothetical protein